MAADAPGRRGRPTTGASGFERPGERARAQMIMRIRTILGDPAVVARIEAALRERIRATRPDMPKALREFLADDEGAVQVPLLLPMCLFHAHPGAPPAGPDQGVVPELATAAKPRGAACPVGSRGRNVPEGAEAA